ncbi:MAG TPA: RNA 2'-phosphotransferase [Polyangiaceae bacterium]|nr:RNA 2'-phosphotransferase [Polyangiaceae bacterium]
MDEKLRTDASKFLSFVLRHEPAAVGIALDSSGWVDVDVLLDAFAQHGRHLSRTELAEIVATSPKQRFALSDDGQRIRANQGHSTAVDLGYEAAEPPDVLYHGTIGRLLPSIREKGLQRMQRHHVHLSPDEATARAVGGRRGRPVILRVDARAMRAAGHVFLVTPNGVWLTDAVPNSFISGWGDD